MLWMRFILIVLFLVELRNISIVLVHTKKDATMGIIISVVIGLILSTFVLIIGESENNPPIHKLLKKDTIYTLYKETGC